jgi:transglutaminase/protease-like cytokinesis protein 3
MKRKPQFCQHWLANKKFIANTQSMMRTCIAVLLVSSVAFGQVTDFATTNFYKADSIAHRFASHPLTDLKMLADNLTNPLGTEQEKFRAIYRWVCSNVEADYELLLLNRDNRSTLTGEHLAEWNKKFNKQVFETLQRDNKTICTGYAYLVRELSYHAGLSCTIVNGYAKQTGIDRTTLGVVNHSWNAIRLQGKWYVCDATWSSGVYNKSEQKFVKRYNDRYFLMEPELFYKTHYPATQALHTSVKP